MRTNPPAQRRAGMRPVVELRAGDARVVIDPERGGRLVSWTLGDRELLVGPPDDDDRSIRWGCYLMAPWPGRLAGGRFEWAGRTIQLPRTHGRNAIHGLLWDRPWNVQAADAQRATLLIDLDEAGWPMGGRVRHHVQLSTDRLELRAEIEADKPMPAAVGWHPWFAPAGDASLHVDSDAFLETERMLPTGRIKPVAGITDLRGTPRLGARRLDHAYVRAAAPAILRWPDLELSIEFVPSPATLVIHTPPRGLCIEPQTAWPNSLAGPRETWEPKGIRVLQEGETLRSHVTMTWRQPSPGTP